MRNEGHKRIEILDETPLIEGGPCYVVMDWIARAAFCGYSTKDDALFQVTPADLMSVATAIYAGINSLSYWFRQAGNDEPPEMRKLIVQSKLEGPIEYCVILGPHCQVVPMIRARLDAQGFRDLPFETPVCHPRSVNLYIIGARKIRPQKKGGGGRW